MNYTKEVSDPNRLILLTGATGYVGGRLLKVFETGGYKVRCLARRPEFLRARVSSSVEVAGGDVSDKHSLKQAMRGVHAAYYFVHSMGASAGFEELDRRAARNFGEAARDAGVKRIIYLGGLGESKEDLSPHLRSRHEVGDILRESGVEVIEFRASIIIGSGSLSFEMIRALVERLPVMITPRWVSVLAQPLAIGDLLEYLVAAIHIPVDGNRIFEIGGSDQVSYGELMREYARQRGLRRIMISVPVLTPRLSSLWLGLITPLYARVGRSLIDSMRHPTIVRDKISLQAFDIRPKGVREAIESALKNEDKEFAETRWSDALSWVESRGDWGGVRFGARLVDLRVAHVEVPAEIAFKVISRIGGAKGWYYGNWLWRVRGFLDLLVGGVGMRRGRRDPRSLRVGDVLDFWRVEAFEHNVRLRLAAEMKVPGRAWLEFEVEGDETNSTIKQTAIFDPVGLWGLAYWYILYPVHELVFRGMLKGIVAMCKRETGPAVKVDRYA
jgi:uncharacterized protein YbjT (DUF2867 family)